ncbi:MAG: universal stress protein, UspA [Methyloprofundus sp.]|nr:universal stress protein, UspA [Methyloprofundus sp.]
MQRFKNILYVVVPDAVNGVAFDHVVTLANNNQARLTVVKVIDKIPSNIKLSGRTFSTETLREKLVAEHQQKLKALVSALGQNIEIQTKILIGTPFLEIIRQIIRNKHDLVIKTAESGRLLDRVFGSDDMHLLRKCPCPVWLIKSKSPKAYHRILAAVDVDDYYPTEELKTRQSLNLQILEMASSLALSESSELHIVNAWETIGEGVLRCVVMTRTEEKVIAYVEEVRQQYKQNLNLLIDRIISKLGQNAFEYLAPQTHLMKGSPRIEIPALAKDIEADLVVMGTVARTGIPGFFMGNTAETILNQLDCSVLAIKPPAFVTPIEMEH